MTPFDAVDLGRDFDFESVDVARQMGPLRQSLLQAAIASTNSEKYRANNWLEYFISHGITVDHQDRNGDTALHYSIARGNNEITMFLINQNSDVNVYNIHGNGPLWAAVINGKTIPDIISALLEKGADIKHKNKYGRSSEDLIKEMNVDWLLRMAKLN